MHVTWQWAANKTDTVAFLHGTGLQTKTHLAWWWAANKTCMVVTHKNSFGTAAAAFKQNTFGIGVDKQNWQTGSMQANKNTFARWWAANKTSTNAACKNSFGIVAACKQKHIQHHGGLQTKLAWWWPARTHLALWQLANNNTFGMWLNNQHWHSGSMQELIWHGDSLQTKTHLAWWWATNKNDMAVAHKTHLVQWQQLANKNTFSTALLLSLEC
jgi:hypothetical protein